MLAKAYKRKPMTPKERCLGTTLPAHYVARAGWSTQVGQQGGRPAVLRYRNGKLVGARYVAGEPSVDFSSEALRRVPKALQWQGKRRNFRVVGQVRKGAFEALAVIMPNDRTLITNFADSSVHAHGLVTPSVARRLKPTKKLSQVSVITTVYPDSVWLVWFHKEKGEVLRKLKFSRP